MTELTNPTLAPSAEPTPLLLRDRIAEAYDDYEMLFLDPENLDSAIVGVVHRVNVGNLVVYDRAKLVAAFVSDGMSDEDADEWVSFNVEGAWVGDRTPLILNSVSELV